MMPSPQPLVSRAGRFLTIHDESFVGVSISSNVYITESDGKYYVFDASGLAAFDAGLQGWGACRAAERVGAPRD